MITKYTNLSLLFLCLFVMQVREASAWQAKDSVTYEVNHEAGKILQLIREQYKNKDYSIGQELNLMVKKITTKMTATGGESEVQAIVILRPDGDTFTPIKSHLIIERSSATNRLRKPLIGYKKSRKKFGKCYQYDLGPIILWSDYDWVTETDGSEFIDYIANDFIAAQPVPRELSLTTDEYYQSGNQLNEVVISAPSSSTYLSGLTTNDELSPVEQELVGSVALQDASHLSLDTRFQVLSLSAKEWGTDPSKKDLVVELLQTTPPSQHQGMMEKLKEYPSVYTAIAEGIYHEGINKQKYKALVYDSFYDIWQGSTYYKDPSFQDPSGRQYSSKHASYAFYQEVSEEMERFIFPSCLNTKQNQSVPELCACLENLPPSQVEKISYEDRIEMLDRILEYVPQLYAVNGISGYYEKPIIKLLQMLPERFAYQDFQNHLTEKRYIHHFESKTTAISPIRLLSDPYENGLVLLPGKFRLELLKALINISSKRPGYYRKVDQLESKISNYQLAEVNKQIVYYGKDKTHILKQFYTTLGSSYNQTFYAVPETSLEDSLDIKNTKLNLNQTLQNKRNVSYTFISQTHAPFDLVLLVDFSGQSSLLGTSHNTNSGIVVPAIAVHFLSDIDPTDKKNQNVLTPIFSKSTAKIPSETINKMLFHSNELQSLAELSVKMEKVNSPLLVSILGNSCQYMDGITPQELTSEGYGDVLMNHVDGLNNQEPVDMASKLHSEAQQIDNLIVNHPDEIQKILASEGGPELLAKWANKLENDRDHLNASLSYQQKENIDQAINGLKRVSSNSTDNFTYRSADASSGELALKNPFEFNGGISASTIFYNSNQVGGREPFTYFLQGNLNINLYQLSMPVSFSLSNQGTDLDYEVPYKFNRISLHPKYKWIQGHLGDVSMQFSPYTLSGHQFTGAGVDMTPQGSVAISAMGGQLLRAVEYDGNENTIPAFQRIGYGSKVTITRPHFRIGIIGFYAKDDINSIPNIPEDQGVTPKENLVVSLEGSYKLLNNLELNGEYASTAITQDLRAETTTNTSQGLAGSLFNNRASTEYYKAFKGGLNYSFQKSTLGVAYERIDPGYETLGAYFFNNDFENITLNTTTVLFGDKVNLAINVGYQRDDLENQKENSSHRSVGSINAAIAASKDLNITTSYSNFTTFTNTKLNQFDQINDNDPTNDELEALDYKQLSQNANVNVNYIVSRKPKMQQVLNVNYALADVANEQGGVVRIGDASTFHNSNTSYSFLFPKKSLTITGGVNLTYNTIGTTNATNWGPLVSVNKKFFENKLNTGFSAVHNISNNRSSTSKITNLRATATYVYREKHNFNLNAINLIKNLNSGNSAEITVTFGYNYAF